MDERIAMLSQLAQFLMGNGSESNEKRIRLVRTHSGGSDLPFLFSSSGASFPFLYACGVM